MVYDTISHYEIIEKLGEARIGVVYKAQKRSEMILNHKEHKVHKG